MSRECDCHDGRNHDDMNIYHRCDNKCGQINGCYCYTVPGPVGATGPTGPTGATGATGPTLTTTQAVAQLLNTAEQTLDTVGELVTFNSPAVYKNAIATTTAITVTNAGTYLVNYGFNASATTGSAMSLYLNGSENVQTRLSILAVGSYSANIILTLTAGETISLGASVISTNVTLPSGSLNAFIDVVPIFIS